MSEGRARLQPKHQRLALVVVAIVVLVTAAIIATWALRSQASYFYVPSDIVKDHPAPGRAVRLGGMVEKGSIVTLPDGVTIEFVVGDGTARVPVRYAGIVPDKLLAKHDENYVPRELEAMTAAQKKLVVEETTAK
jgi:cytochrome c-type biogenesis protein CcmE